MLQYICGQAVCQACEGMSFVIVKQMNVCESDSSTLRGMDFV